MSIDELIADVKAITSNVIAGNIAAAVKAGGAFLSGVGELMTNLGFRATADHDAKCNELDAALTECHAACSAAGFKGAGQTEDMSGKIFPGDGSFLKMLVELFMKFAPLFVKKQPS